jgi:hypothetical protein
MCQPTIVWCVVGQQGKTEKKIRMRPVWELTDCLGQRGDDANCSHSAFDGYTGDTSHQ